MAYVRFNRTILTSIPEPPPYIFNVTQPAGIYIFGDIAYKGTSRSIVPTWHRRNKIPIVRTNIQNFVMGTMSVVLIALISDISQSILLRSTGEKISSDGVMAAYLLDESLRFRNVWTQAVSHRMRNISLYRRLSQQRVTIFSTVVLLVSLGIFVIDAVAVHVIRPQLFNSNMDNFNLRGLQPVVTTRVRSRNINLELAGRPCVSPIVRRPLQRRLFKINSCTFFDSHEAGFRKRDVAENFVISSWYHEGGSDHNISFDQGWHSISIRSEIETRSASKTMRILFNESVTRMTDTRYIHDVTMHAIMEWSCNKKFSTSSCEQLVSDLVLRSSVEENREFELWTSRKGTLRTNVTGLVSTYKSRIHIPYKAVSDGKHILVASSAVAEVDGPGWYEDFVSGDRVNRIEALVVEQGMLVGVYMLMVVLVSTFALSGLLKCLLRPVSLGYMALLHGKETHGRNRRS